MIFVRKMKYHMRGKNKLAITNPYNNCHAMKVLDRWCR